MYNIYQFEDYNIRFNENIEVRIFAQQITSKSNLGCFEKPEPEIYMIFLLFNNSVI